MAPLKTPSKTPSKESLAEPFDIQQESRHNKYKFNGSIDDAIKDAINGATRSRSDQALMIKSIAQLGTISIVTIATLLSLTILAAWETLQTIGGVMIYLGTGLIIITGLIWLVSFTYRQWCDAQLANEAVKRATLETRQAQMDHAFSEAALLAQTAQLGANLIYAKQVGSMQFIHHPKTQAVPPVLPPARLPAEPDQSSYLALPAVVHIDDLLQADQANIKRLILGVGPGHQIIRGDIKELSHIGIAGTSRWGKSIFLQTLLYQILLAQQNVSLRLSDIGGTSFVDFGLTYADDITSTEDLVSELWIETMKRKALYQATGQGVRNLEMYNQITDQALPYIVFMADEITVLISKSKKMAQTIMDLVAYAGKYGIELILAGQNWKASHVDSTIRDQFSSRFQFKAMDRSQANILIPGSDAHEITVKGRAVTYLPEHGRTELQTPLIDVDTIQALKPTILDLGESSPNQPDPFEMVIVGLYQNEASLNECVWKFRKLTSSKAVSRPGTNDRLKIVQILQAHGITPRSEHDTLWEKTREKTGEEMPRN